MWAVVFVVAVGGVAFALRLQAERASARRAAAPLAPLAPGARPAPAAPLPVFTEVPDAEPGLDRELARTYRNALEGQGIKVVALVITDRRKMGGARRADVVYQTATGGTLKALRPEITRIAGPAASPRLALDQITIRAARRGGAIAATVSIGIPDIDRWLKAQISDDDFYRTWVVQTRPR